MKRLLWLLIFLCLLCLGSSGALFAKTWSVDSAKQEAFDDLSQWIETGEFLPGDPNFFENMQALTAGQRIVGNRMVTAFDQGNYCVAEHCSIYSYYYMNDGRLTSIEVNSSPAYADPKACPALMPVRSAKYCYGSYCQFMNLPQGSLIQTTLLPDPLSSYIFLPDGRLSEHWVHGKCYNADGAQCAKR